MRRIRRSDAARQERLDKRLYKAVTRGNVGDVKQYIEEGAKLISYGQLGTPLHAAVANGHISVCMILLEAGSPTNLMGETCYAPLHLACRHDHAPIVSALINHNSDLDIRSKFELRAPLHIAARRNLLTIAELLVAKKATVDIRDLYGNTPLHMAARGGYTEFVDHLLSHGADPDVYDNDGWTALHYAANEGHTEIIKSLITKKALIDQQNKYGRTPLHWACAGHRIPAVETLLSLGASTIIRDRQGKLAENSTNDNVIKQIIKLYENNVAKGDDSAGVTTLDLHMTLKPFIRSLSRVESHDSRTSGRDEVDSRRTFVAMPTSPDQSNCLKTMFGEDIVELIDECFGQDDDIGMSERQESCLKYKQFLMTVASLLQNSSTHMNTLYTTVSTGLQNKSQVQIIDILKVIFDKVQKVEDNLNDFQTEIRLAVRSLSLSFKDITDSCIEYARVNDARPNLFTVQDKVNHFTQAQILEEVASLIAKHKDMWRKLLPKLQPDLSEKDASELEKRIETYTKDETKRATTMLYAWHIPKDLSDSEPHIASNELCGALSDFDKSGHLTEEIKEMLEKFETTAPLIHLVDLNPKTASVGGSKSVSFETNFDAESADC